MKIYVGRWDLLPYDWEGINRLEKATKEEIIAELAREIQDYDNTHNYADYFLSLHEADAVACMLLQNYTAEDIIEYIEWCEKRYEQDEETDVDIWLEETGRE